MGIYLEIFKHTICSLKFKGEVFVIIEILLIIIGFIFLIKGADFLVMAASNIAKRFGLSEMLIGLTIVAIGTSLPEVFVTIISASLGHSDLIIGNAIGSCICNFLLVIGITSLIRPVKLDKRIINRHLPIGMAAMILLLVLGNTDKLGIAHVITRGQGIALLGCTFIYILYTIYEERHIKNEKIDIEILEEVEALEEKSILKIILLMILGALGLKFGADFVVDNSIVLAEEIGLSERFIGMTIVAIGTALPEIVTGIIAALKDETDLLLGNISGSNILNLCLLIGLGAVINPLTFTTGFNASIVVLLLITVFIQMVAILSKDSKLDRKKGLILIAIYIVYILGIL